MTDIQKMLGEFDPPKTEGEMTVLTGSAPVVTMRDYQKEVFPTPVAGEDSPVP